MTIALAFFITLSLWLFMRLWKFNNLVRFQREYIEIIEDDLQEMEEHLMSIHKNWVKQLEDGPEMSEANKRILEGVKDNIANKERIT